MSSRQQTIVSRKSIVAGRIISGLCIVFMLFDAIAKLFLERHSIEGTAVLGLSVSSVRPIGITLLAATILYMVPRTALLGAVLITAFLGGAVAIMARAGVPFFFPVMLCVLVWGGVWLRNPVLRAAFSGM